MPSTRTRTRARLTTPARATTRAGGAPRTPFATRARLALGTALLVVVAVSACSGSGQTASTIAPARGAASPGASDSGSAATGQAAPGAVQGGTAVQGQAVPGEAAKDASGAALAAAGDPAQKIARTAHLSMTVTDVAATATQVRGVAIGAGGSVTSENISTRPPGDDQPPVPVDGATSSPLPADPANRVTQGESVPVGRGTNTGLLTLSVPAATLDSVLDQLARLGTVVQRTSSSQDVTATYVDAQSRIATMKASLDRLRALMSKATEIGQIVTLESELTRREADLESLQARLAGLDRQTTMATVAVVLSATAAATPGTANGGGFLGGLRSGWSAFTALLGGLVTGAGAALPFLATVLVLGAPALLWWRRRRSGARASGVPAAAEAE